MQVVDKQLLMSNFTDLTSTWIRPKTKGNAEALTQENLQERKRDKAEAMRRGYEQRAEQMRLMSKRQVEVQQQKADTRLRKMQRQLARGNEETLRDCDATLAVANTEAQIRKERLFIDWEMNVFLPIHKRLIEDVRARDHRAVSALRREAYQEYLDACGSSYVALDMPTAKYDPFKIEKQLRLETTVSVDDPLHRPLALQAMEDEIYRGVGGRMKVEVPPRARSIAVESFSSSKDLLFGDGYRPGRRMIVPKHLDPPMAIDADVASS
ncbi:hypothetical protein GMRT_15579 [Giardia muris]|uniref:Uncharacterized protein n=1 Tax=Giardia muris TaxID=5742 RepID=A0A4Z1T8A9_GIAMU|nr:hypothetical protein GMRT_15579 [Giardia muris]|eukprot:TNJ28829.1 hypothetical protein GMRT_15579 [Giardia muris]